MKGNSESLLVIVNRCYPPYSGITGSSAFELARFIQSKREFEVKAVCVADNFSGYSNYSDCLHPVTAIKPIYTGKKKWLRFFGTIYESIQMISKVKKLVKGYKSAKILVMTEPPLLNIFAVLLLRNNFDWGLWSMDLYPEGLHASGFLYNEHFIYKRIQKLFRKYPPSFVISLGPEQQQLLRKTYEWETKYFIVPCGIRTHIADNVPKPVWANTKKVIFGYCGNVGEAHNEQFIIDCVQLLNPEEHVFIASLYGSKGKKVEEIIKRYPHVIIKDGVAPEEMSIIDVHLVSLLDKWLHVCVPSKVVSGVSSGASFLFNGSADGDTWKYLANAGWRIDQRYLIEDLKQLISSIDKSSVNDKRKKALEISFELNKVKDTEFNRILNYFIESGFLLKEETDNSSGFQ